MNFYKGIDEVEQFEALFNFATIGIVVTNSESVIINFNRYAESQFGYAKEEVVGQPVEILIPPASHQKHVAYRNNFTKDPHPRRMGEGRDLKGQRKDGQTFPVEVSLSYYTRNNETYVIAFIIDITVRKKNEQVVIEQKEELERVTREIRQLNTGLEQKVEDRTKMLRETLSALEQSKQELSDALETEKELSELKSRFVTMASHEFRTPLSTILSSTFLLEKYNNIDEPAKREKHIQRIKGAVNDMKSILEDFLSLGRLEEGLVNITIETLTPAECKAILQELVQDMEQQLKPGQQIVITFDGEHNIEIDKQLLKNILINLLSNAIKFSPENASIYIHANSTPDLFTFSVKDSGIGISEEDQAHLFERFFRAKNASNIQGTGLGLHIIDKYLGLMNGRIRFESKLNEGTMFTISIPQPIV